MHEVKDLIVELLAALGAFFVVITQVLQIINQAELVKLAHRTNRKFDDALDQISHQALSLKTNHRRASDVKKIDP